jgi:ribosomal protein L37AE/L43A
MKKEKTRVTAIVCEKCGDTIYSRDRHDFHYCSCGDVAIDGGFDYMKVSFKTGMPKIVHVDVDATKKELFDDWNYQTDKFGVITKNESKTPLTKKKNSVKITTTRVKIKNDKIV